MRKPLADIEQDVRRKFGVVTALLDASLEPDALVLTFAGTHQARTSRSCETNPESGSDVNAGSATDGPSRRRRSKKRVRQRTKTRGWDVVGKFVNSKGLRCTIYRPMYDALLGKKLRRREAYSVIREILLANGNNPKPSTIEYFLDNTLEYLTQPRSPGTSGRVEDNRVTERSGSEAKAQPLEPVRG